jgi:hypothetical protein
MTSLGAPYPSYTTAFMRPDLPRSPAIRRRRARRIKIVSGHGRAGA